MSDEPDESPPDRTLTWWPFAGAVVIGAIVLAVVLTVGSDGDGGAGTQRDANGALACPATVGDSVPADPSGVDGKAALAPDTAPDHVTLCRYTRAAKREATAKLVGHRQLSHGLRLLGRDLSTLPAAAGSAGAVDDSTVYLLGMTYATGFVWVQVPRASVGPGNGQFIARGQVFARVDQAFRTGTWTS